MQVRRTKIRKPQRGGFTLIELLVVISIIATLAALILPGVQASREQARRLTCTNNQSNVAKALIAFSADKGGQLPQFRDETTVTIGADTTFKVLESGAPGTYVSRPMSWMVAILPNLEAGAIYDRLTDDQVAAPSDFNSLRTQLIGGYQCPDDPEHGIGGQTSYAANVGYFLEDTALGNAPGLGDVAWQGTMVNTDAARTIAMSANLFINANGGARRTGITNMGDGSAATILFTENIQSSQWVDPAVGANGIGIGLNHATSVPTDLGGAAGALQITTNLLSNIAPMPYKINSDRNAVDGTRPRPSSLHPGGVVVTFCDGHNKFLLENMDDRVYSQILTPSGSRYGQDNISAGSFE